MQRLTVDNNALRFLPPRLAELSNLTLRKLSSSAISCVEVIVRMQSLRLVYIRVRACIRACILQIDCAQTD